MENLSVRGRRPALWAALLVGTLAAPWALAETLINTSVPMDGLALPHPCTGELLAFSGPLHVTGGATLSGGGAHVRLHVNSQGVTATGQVTGARYNSPDIVNTGLHLGPLPATGQAVVMVRFVGPGEDRFRARIQLHVAVSSSGNVTVSLGSVTLECS